MIKQVFKKPYVYYFSLVFLIYLILNIAFSQFYITVQYIPKYLETIKWQELIVSALLSLAIGFLVSLNSILVYLRYKERKNIKKQTFFASLGIIGGFFTGICSACVAGLSPLIFSLFGISFSFLSLPLKGIEIQLLVVLILLINLYLLKKH